MPSRAISQILVCTKDSECHLQMTLDESRWMNMVESKHGACAHHLKIETITYKWSEFFRSRLSGNSFVPTSPSTSAHFQDFFLVLALWMGGNWKGSRCALLPVLIHKVWWREDSDPPFLHPGTIKGKDSPIWSSGLCALQSTGQVDSSAFAWSDYWEITALHLNWHFCLSLMSDLTEGSRGGESILLCGY